MLTLQKRRAIIQLTIKKPHRCGAIKKAPAEMLLETTSPAYMCWYTYTQPMNSAEAHEKVYHTFAETARAFLIFPNFSPYIYKTGEVGKGGACGKDGCIRLKFLPPLL